MDLSLPRIMAEGEVLWNRKKFVNQGRTFRHYKEKDRHIYLYKNWYNSIVKAKANNRLVNIFLMQMFAKMLQSRDFPGGPVVKKQCFHCQGPGFNPH